MHDDDRFVNTERQETTASSEKQRSRLGQPPSFLRTPFTSSRIPWHPRFSSFSAAAFQQSVHFQHLQSTQAQAQAQLAGITQLAQHYLQSSSDSEPGGSKRDLLDPPSPPSSPPSPAHLTQPPLKRSKLSSKHKDKKGGKQKRARTSTAASERHQQRQEVLRAEQRLAAATAAARGLGKAVGAGVTGLGAGFPWSSAAPSIVPSGPPALYFDTRGDFQNLVYRGLYATNIAAFARRDPLGLTPAAAARRARRAANWLDVEQGGGRYWHAAQVLAQRDRGLRRLHLAAPAPSPSSSSSSTVAPLGGYTALGSSHRRLSRALPLPTYIPLHAPPTGARPGSAIPTAFGHQQGGAGRLEGLAGGSGRGEEEGETLDQWVLRRTQEFSVATRAQPHRCQLWLDYAAWQDQAARLVGRRPARQGGASSDAAAVAEKKVAILEHGLQLNPAQQQQQQQQQQEGPEGLGLQLGTACLWRTYLQLRQATFSVYSFQALQAGHQELGVARLQALLEYQLCAPLGPRQPAGHGSSSSRGGGGGHGGGWKRRGEERVRDEDEDEEEGEEEVRQEEEQEEEEEEEEGEKVDEQKLLTELGLRLEQELEGVKQRGVGPDLLSRWVAVEQQRSQAAGAAPFTLTQGATRGAAPGKGEEGEGVEEGEGGEVLKTPAQRYQLALAALALLGVPLGGGWLSTNLPLLLLPEMCSRVYSSSLAAAPSLPLRQRLEQLPPLVLQAAQQELCSGQQGLAAVLGLQGRGEVGGKLEGRPGGPKGGEPGQAYTTAVAAVARAGHLLVWLLAAGCDPSCPGPCNAYSPSNQPPTATQLTAARLGFSRLAPLITQAAYHLEGAAPQPTQPAGSACPAAAGAWQHPGTHMGWAALVAAAGLLEVVVGRLAVWGGQGAGAGAQPHEEGGVGSAMVVLKNTVAGAPLEVRRISPAHEWLQVFFCEVLVSEACSGSTQLSPARIRAHLAEALVLYPHNPSLLQLLVVTEQRAHAHVRLRHYLHTACAAGPTPQLLATCLACEASSGIPDGRPLSAQPALRSRLHAIFERSAADKRLAVCPQLWLMYLSYEAECSNAEAVRRVFLRAVRACPGCKDVWMAGFAASAGMAVNEVQQASLAAGGRTLAPGDAPAGAALSAREAAELLEVMAAKGLHVYTDVAEVVMMALEDE
ncbi:hypothetical protein QJQ45_006426 [Haematococcus lacustris]|nr:hypothetical protein QJQ45_006426 [Haematococcus lacustris]